MRTARIQVVVSEEELRLVTAALERWGTTASSQGRSLLVMWAERVLDQPGSRHAGRCGTADCTKTDARWYNTNTQRFYCMGCAEHANALVSHICVLDGGPQVSEAMQSAIDDATRLAGQTGTHRAAKLVRAIREALAEHDASEIALSTPLPPLPEGDSGLKGLF